jgi:thymidine phosphorylase
MLPQEIIRKKRDRRALSEAEIGFFVDGLTSGRITEGQVAALAMAIVLNGMDEAETVALTRAMTASGATLTWSDMPGPVVDKHSTGGIGDKVSLILAPVMAALGAYVPMISGRGLGHTGGTLDKLDAIPGYDTKPPLDRLRRAVREAGCAIVGQTPELAPADRRLYAIRDVTATVESRPLIVASILSKKLAAGLDALVMDVKVGSGAFLPSLDAARELAGALVAVAGGAGLPCRALLTDMSQCLGRTAGNALEVKEALDLLAGRAHEPRLREVTISLCAELALTAGLASTPEEARQRNEQALASGAAAERFERMVRALGGPPDILERSERHLAGAPVRHPVLLPEAGHIRAIDARALGLAVIGLGGGRTSHEEGIDHAVGLTEVKGLGEPTHPHEPFAIVHARSEEAARSAAEAIAAAVTVGDPGSRPSPLIHGRIGAAHAEERS